MAKANPLSRPMPNASLPRNSFDRSFIKNVNWSAGMLLPLFCEYVPAGSKCRINRSVFMRTAQLNTAAFPVLDHNIDFYRVPLRLLMTRYNEFKTNIQDTNSSSLYPKVNGSYVPTPPSRMPYIKTQDIYSLGSSGLTDDFGYDISYGAARLLDLLGYDDSYIGGAATHNLELNAFKLLAYQKCYYDHYRNTAYESNLPSAYNADFSYSEGFNGYISYSNGLADLLKIHYVNYRKDYFQALYPSLNYIAADSYATNWGIPSSVVDGFLNQNGTTSTYVDSVSGDDRDHHNLYTGGVSILIRDPSQTSPRSVYRADPSDVSNVYGNEYHSHIFSQKITHDVYSPQGIRIAFALDKLLRASAYAPKHVKDQLEARYGVKLRANYGDESEYLGSFANSVSIGEVTSTANTVNGNAGDELGAIGGKGVSGQAHGKTIDCFCEDDSIVIGIAYTMVRSMYDSHRIDQFNLKHVREDLPIPEYMDLGLRPIYRHEFVNDLGYNAQASNYILGYVTRDQEYKVGIDQNHGLFRLNSQLGVFTNHTNIASRAYAAGNHGVTGLYFKLAPSDLDSIFVSNFDPADQKTDQFFGQFRFDFQCRQNMSVHGQPSL